MRLRHIAAIGVFIALVCAAFNWLTASMYVLVATTALLIAVPLVAAIRAVPPEARHAWIDAKLFRNAAFCAIVLSCVFSYGYTTPLPFRVLRSLAVVWPMLDFVPSCFAQLLPSGMRSGMHCYFVRGTYCFPGPRWWEAMRYLRTAIPANTIAMIVIVIGSRVMRSIAKHHRSTRAVHSPVSFS